MYFGSFCFRRELSFLKCDDICTCVVNKQFALLEFVFDSVYVSLQYIEISRAITAVSVSVCSVCSHVVVFGLSVRSLWYPIWIQRIQITFIRQHKHVDKHFKQIGKHNCT